RHPQRNDESDQRMQPQPGDQHRHQDAGKADHRADRQVDAARDDDEGHAHGGNTEESIGGEEIAQHAGGEHVGKLGDARRIGDEKDNGGGRQRAKTAFHRGAACLGSRLKKPKTWPTSGDCSIRIRMIIPALTMRLNSGGKPDTRMPVFIAWMISAPTTASGTENLPPSSEVPPMTTARMASSSSHSPELLASAPRISAATIMPAIAAQNPLSP